MTEQEYFFKCPYCREKISMLLDASAQQQDYIEDCEVCCRPIQLQFSVENDVICSFSAGRTL